MFNGFPTLADYERNYSRVGIATERRACHDASGDRFTVLISHCDGCPPSWYLFPAAGGELLLSGFVPSPEYVRNYGGTDQDFLGKLARNGYYLDCADDDAGDDADENDAPEYCAVADLGDGWQQLALFG